eukprot:gene13607-biopygen8040
MTTEPWEKRPRPRPVRVRSASVPRLLRALPLDFTPDADVQALHSAARAAVGEGPPLRLSCGGRPLDNPRMLLADLGIGAEAEVDAAPPQGDAPAVPLPHSRFLPGASPLPDHRRPLQRVRLIWPRRRWIQFAAGMFCKTVQRNIHWPAQQISVSLQRLPGGRGGGRRGVRRGQGQPPHRGARRRERVVPPRVRLGGRRRRRVRLPRRNRGGGRRGVRRGHEQRPHRGARRRERGVPPRVRLGGRRRRRVRVPVRGRGGGRRGVRRGHVQLPRRGARRRERAVPPRVRLEGRRRRRVQQP